MADNLMLSIMMIHEINPSVDYNQWFIYLDTELIDPTNQNLIKVPKCYKANKFENFGNYCNKQPFVPYLPEYFPFSLILPPPPLLLQTRKTWVGGVICQNIHQASVIWKLSWGVVECWRGGGGQYKEIIIFKVLRTTEH